MLRELEAQAEAEAKLLSEQIDAALRGEPAPQLDSSTRQFIRDMKADMDAALAEALAESQAELDDDPKPPPMVLRSDYVPKDDEARYMTRDAAGLPDLWLVEAGDRLAVWSPLDGGVLLNPKGPGLRRLGLVTTRVRGTDHHGAAFRDADLRPGKPVALVREPANEYDPNAVALREPGKRVPFGYVQRGRAPAVARRMDAGETLTAVSMRGPGPGQTDGVTSVLIASDSDLRHMLG
jgi:hypothetical protein